MQSSKHGVVQILNVVLSLLGSFLLPLHLLVGRIVGGQLETAEWTRVGLSEPFSLNFIPSTMWGRQISYLFQPAADALLVKHVPARQLAEELVAGECSVS